MPIGRFTFGGPCCGCIIKIDDFHRADSGTPGAGYTVVSGTWPIASNQLTTASTNAVLVSTTTHSGSIYLQAVLETATSGDLIRLIIGYVDASNYYFAEIKVGDSSTGYARIYSRIAGVNTQLSQSITYPFYLDIARSELEICYNAATGRIAVISYGVVVNEADAGVGALTGDKFGLGTGATNASGIAFSLLQVLDVSADCQQCDGCAECDEAELPATLDATLAGYHTDSFYNWLAGTYTLAKITACVYEMTTTLTITCDCLPARPTAETHDITIRATVFKTAGVRKWMVEVFDAYLTCAVVIDPPPRPADQVWYLDNGSATSCIGSYGPTDITVDNLAHVGCPYTYTPLTYTPTCALAV